MFKSKFQFFTLPEYGLNVEVNLLTDTRETSQQDSDTNGLLRNCNVQELHLLIDSMEVQLNLQTCTLKLFLI
jgi:hypothetical protein